MLNNIEESAIKLAVSPRHIRRLIQGNRIKHYKIGNRIRISDEHIAEYLESVEREVSQRW